jgi:hypothetical protein
MDRARARSAHRALTITASVVVGISVAAAVHAAAGTGQTAAVTYTALAARTAATGPAASSPAAPPYSCAPNGPAGSQTIYGTFGDASVIGWTGNSQAVTACLGGSFFVTTGNGPGSGSTAAVSGTTYGYGIYNDSATTWANADGYLPALVTSFHRDGALIAITNFGDQVTIGGHRYVAIYSRVSVTNPTSAPLTLSPQASPGLIPLNAAADQVAPHATVRHDYVVASDRFGGTYAFPSRAALAAAGGYDQHFAHMRAYWNGQLAHIAQIVTLPDASLADAYRTGFIYTQIIRSGNELKTGANGYDTEFSHDVIGILANLFTQGYTSGAHGLLDRARFVIGSQTQYDDGVWTYPWVWAIYLEKTGDLKFVKGQLRRGGARREVRAEHRGHGAPDRRRPHRAGRDHGEDQRHRRQRLLDDRQLRGADRAGHLPVARDPGRQPGPGPVGRRPVPQPAGRHEQDAGRHHGGRPP